LTQYAFIVCKPTGLQGSNYVEQVEGITLVMFFSQILYMKFNAVGNIFKVIVNAEKALSVM